MFTLEFHSQTQMLKSYCTTEHNIYYHGKLMLSFYFDDHDLPRTRKVELF